MTVRRWEELIDNGERERPHISEIQFVPTWLRKVCLQKSIARPASPSALLKSNPFFAVRTLKFRPSDVREKSEKLSKNGESQATPLLPEKTEPANIKRSLVGTSGKRLGMAVGEYHGRRVGRLRPVSYTLPGTPGHT